MLVEIRYAVVAAVQRIAEPCALRLAITNNKPSPISYVSPPAEEILKEDKVIEAYRINVKPEAVEVVPVDRIFQ